MELEYTENNLLVVDEGIYDPHLSNHIVIRVNGELYLLNVLASKKPIKESDLRPYKSHIDKSWYRLSGVDCCIYGLMLRNFEVSLGRAITDDEFEAIKKKYNLTDDDVSADFEDTKGAIFGERAKKYTAKQIRVLGADIAVESELQSKGIQANNIAPGRVNIRTHGGYRPGSGRKKELPEGAKPCSFRLTKDEQVKVREFINQLRK